MCLYFVFMFWSIAAFPPLIFCLQVSDDDSYISDVSDSISMDTCSNEGGSERHNSGTWCSSKLCVCVCVRGNNREKDRRCKQTLFFHRGSSVSVHLSVTKPLCIFQKVSNKLWMCGIRESTHTMCWTWLPPTCLQTQCDVSSKSVRQSICEQASLIHCYRLCLF